MTAKDYLGTLEDYSFQFSKPPPRGVKSKKHFQSTSKYYILNLTKLFTNLLEYWLRLNYTELVPEYSHLLPVLELDVNTLGRFIIGTFVYLSSSNVCTDIF